MLRRAPLGAIIAGGASSRYGAPKALAKLAGERIIDRVAGALSVVAADVIVIANDPVVADAVEYDSRPDMVAGAGALGGVLTALLWARERSHEWILAVACDMPFASHALLEKIADRSAQTPAPDVVLPASPGPRGVEPLCGAYRTSCVDPIRAAIESGDSRMIGFHGAVRVLTVPIEEVETFGDPELLFMNVNTPHDMERAKKMLEREASR